MTKQPKTIAYIRRSTARQELSVERQRTQLELYAEREGISIDEYRVEEPLSGKTPLSDRPALQVSINSLRKGDTLLALSVSRVARDELVFYSVLNAIAKKGATLTLADGSSGEGSNPLNKMLMGVMLLVASAERQAIADRTKQALAVLRKEGRALGRPDRVRYGYTNQDGKLVENPHEQRILRRMKALRHDGLTYKQISAKLADEGLLSRTHKPFQLPVLSQLLRGQKKFHPA